MPQHYDPLADHLPAWTSIIPADPDLSLFQKILLATDGTVTELLSLYCGKPVTARKQDQPASAVLDNARMQEIAAPRLVRTVLLEDSHGHPLLHASSCFALGLMPESIRRDLEQTDLPIGLLWRRERLEMYREIQECRRGTAPLIARLLDVAPDAPLLGRTYCLFYQKQVMGLITETFATSVLH